METSDLSNLMSMNNVASEIDDKIIVVTGGTGSFGQCFVKFLLSNFLPKKLIVFSRDELKQYEMEKKFPRSKFPNIRYFIGDVRDMDRLELAFREADIVIHAAALKHVPIAESNPFECIRTNVIGAENVVKASLRTGVEKVIALSTDKAVNPINLYGSSKLAADKIFVSANALAGEGGTKFSVVRYGNVVGSRGSVVPFFLKLMKTKAQTLPITDIRMTRFWITLENSVKFVLSCMLLMRSGEIFVPKIPSMRIVDLAKAIAPKLSHEIVGIRPGEKLHEIMITSDDARRTFELPDRYIIAPEFFEFTPSLLLRDLEKVEPDFNYSSDTNSDWLNAKQLAKMISAQQNK